MRGISTVLAAILIVIIVVALVGLTYTFSVALFGVTAGAGERMTETGVTGLMAQMRVETISGNKIYIRNVGTTDLSNFTILVNNEKVQDFGVDPLIIESNQMGTITINDYIGTRENEITILSSEGGTITKKTDDAVFCNNTDVVLCLTFDEGSGNITYDQSPYGNYGVLVDKNTTNADGDTPPKWVDGINDKALEFDSIDDFVNISILNLNIINGKFTFEIWGKIYSIGTGLGAGKYNDIINTYAPSSAYSYEIWIEDGDTVYGWFNVTGVWTDDIEEPNLVTIDSWYHIVFTYDTDSGSDNLKLYVNGLLENSTSITGDLFITTNPTHIGHYVTDYFYHGIIDEIRILNKTLTAEEVANIYENILGS
jgi:hypothetical protein